MRACKMPRMPLKLLALLAMTLSPMALVMPAFAQGGQTSVTLMSGNNSSKNGAPVTSPIVSFHGSVDTPKAGAHETGSFLIAGWALDRGAASGTGVDQVEVFDGGTGVHGTGKYLGSATLGYSRTDLVSPYGAQFRYGGYGYLASALSTGTHSLYVYGHVAATDTWHLIKRTVTVTATNQRGNVDTPTEGKSVASSLTVAGWAADINASSGTGIDQVKVFEGDNISGTLLGSATYGHTRTDITKALGSQFTKSGYSFTTSGLASGTHTLSVYAHNVSADTWVLIRTRTIVVSGGTTGHGARSIAK